MNAIEIFVDGINRLLKSNLLSSGKEIRSFLISVTENDDLKEVFKSACSDFDLESEFIRVLDSGKLPARDDKKVAFVTSVLFLTDTGELPLTDLLSILYPNGNEYSEFLEKMIEPYAESFANLLEKVSYNSNTDTQKAEHRNPDSDMKALTDEIKITLKKTSLPTSAKENIIAALDGISYAIPFNDPKLVANAYSGFENTLRLYSMETEYEEDLKRLLRNYGAL